MSMALTDCFEAVLRKRTRGGEQSGCIVGALVRIRDVVDDYLGKGVSSLAECDLDEGERHEARRTVIQGDDY